MRNTILIILVPLVLATGCMMKDGAKSEDAAEPAVLAAVQLANVKAETKEAAQAMEAYVYARRLEFVANMTGELVAIQAEMDRLAAKAEDSGDVARADVRAATKARLDAARGRWAEAKARLDAAGSATEATWDDVRAGFERSYDELKASFDQARQALSDKIEP
jgi:chemotaxis protein histidine kinase CheA